MNDFSKITKTLDGFDCHYFGVRESYGAKLHCFGVMTGHGVHEKCYDDEGQQLFFNPHIREWVRSKSDAFQIIAPPKIVEVTRWVGFYGGNVDSHGNRNGDGFHVCTYQYEPKKLPDMLAKQQHTFRFEVPNE